MSSTPPTDPTPGASSSSVSDTHLSYPTPTIRPSSPSPPPIPASRELNKNRLYIGNLHPTVDEYALLQVFNKFGKISKLDFLFHKTGPSKGKPRGYAFVEYSEKDDALRALVNTHDKLLRGRKLTVTYAHHAPTTEYNMPSRPNYRKSNAEMSRPTTLSLLKTRSHPGNTQGKIAALEAKLQQLERSPQESSSSNSLHPSLPSKPISVPSTFTPSPNHTPVPPAARRRNPHGLNEAKGPGKKPTLEELMKGPKATGLGSFIKR